MPENGASSKFIRPPPQVAARSMQWARPLTVTIDNTDTCVTTDATPPGAVAALLMVYANEEQGWEGAGSRQVHCCCGRARTVDVLSVKSTVHAGRHNSLEELP